MQYAIVLVNELVNHLQRREEGQALVEYGLILALIAVVCIVALQALGGAVSAQLTAIGNAIAGA